MAQTAVPSKLKALYFFGFRLSLSVIVVRGGGGGGGGGNYKCSKFLKMCLPFGGNQSKADCAASCK